MLKTLYPTVSLNRTRGCGQAGRVLSYESKSNTDTQPSKKLALAYTLPLGLKGLKDAALKAMDLVNVEVAYYSPGHTAKSFKDARQTELISLYPKNVLRVPIRI